MIIAPTWRTQRQVFHDPCHSGRVPDNNGTCGDITSNNRAGTNKTVASYAHAGKKRRAGTDPRTMFQHHSLEVLLGIREIRIPRIGQYSVRSNPDIVHNDAVFRYERLAVDPNMIP